MSSRSWSPAVSATLNRITEAAEHPSDLIRGIVKSSKPLLVEMAGIQCHIELRSDLRGGALGDTEELVEFSRTPPLKSFSDLRHD
jgi:hypothetical protein